MRARTYGGLLSCALTLLVCLCTDFTGSRIQGRIRAVRAGCGRDRAVQHRALHQHLCAFQQRVQAFLQSRLKLLVFFPISQPHLSRNHLLIGNHVSCARASQSLICRPPIACLCRRVRRVYSSCIRRQRDPHGLRTRAAQCQAASPPQVRADPVMMATTGVVVVVVVVVGSGGGG